MSVVGSNLVCQVGFIVKDIYATKKKWAEFLGVEEPEANLCGEYEIMQTEYMGAPAPEANSLLAFFDVGPGLQLEMRLLPLGGIILMNMERESIMWPLTFRA